METKAAFLQPTDQIPDGSITEPPLTYNEKKVILLDAEIVRIRQAMKAALEALDDNDETGCHRILTVAIAEH